jgi:hypothetical protein
VNTRILAQLRTGDAVYFRGTGLVPRLIRFGTRLGAWLRREPVPGFRPSHVEIVLVSPTGDPFLFGADSFAGFIRKPALRRLAGLKHGRDYLVVRLGLSDYEQALRGAILALEGTPYTRWGHVARVWRDRAPDDGSETVYCSEAVLRAWQGGGVPWALPVCPANHDPLESLRLAQRFAM